MIITGGKKVVAGAVEDRLRTLPGVSDLVILGVADGEWGQRVTAFVPVGERPTDAAIATALADLPRYHWPRQWVELAVWPRTPQGKVNRTLLRQCAEGA